VDNQTTDSIFISRLGAADQQVLLPKRIVRTVDLPLIPGGVESLQMLQVTFPNSIIVPETSFAGFNGRFDQAASLTVSPPRKVKIQYPAGTGSDNPTSAPGIADGGSAVSGGGYAGTGYPGNWQAPGNNGSANYPTARTGRTNTSNSKASEPPSFATATKAGERRKSPFPGATAVRVKVPNGGPETLITPPEPPAPIQASKPVVALKPSTLTATAPAKKGNLRSIILWSSIAAGLLGFMIWKGVRSQ
jgi:hypothetical protein